MLIIVELNQVGVCLCQEEVHHYRRAYCATWHVILTVLWALFSDQFAICQVQKREEAISKAGMSILSHCGCMMHSTIHFRTMFGHLQAKHVRTPEVSTEMS